MKRSKGIPDEYKGDKHLSNWFRKRMQMTGLYLVFVHPDNFIRDELTRIKITILEGEVYFQYTNGDVVKVNYSATVQFKVGVL